MPCPYEQKVTQSDINGYKRNKPILTAVNGRYHKNGLIKIYLTCCTINGRLHTESIAIFGLILESKPIDKDERKNYDLGVKHGSKMIPFKHFKTIKEKSCYETGRYYGRNNIT